MSSNACSRVTERGKSSQIFSRSYRYFSQHASKYFSQCGVSLCIVSRHPNVPGCVKCDYEWRWLGWAGLRLVCGGWWRLPDLGGCDGAAEYSGSCLATATTEEPDAWCRAPSSSSSPATPSSPAPARQPSAPRPRPSSPAPWLWCNQWWHSSLAAQCRPAPAPPPDSSTSSVISSVLCLLHLFTPLLQAAPPPPRPQCWMNEAS